LVTATALYPAEPSLTMTVAGTPVTSGVPANVALGNAVLTHAVSGFSQTYTLSTNGFPTREAYIKAGDGAAGDAFSGGSNACSSNTPVGCGVAISGDTLVVGAPCAGAQTGAVYVFKRTNTSWLPQQKLALPTTLDSFAQFGVAVAISGDMLVVGAP